jgi:hypothetical protein
MPGIRRAWGKRVPARIIIFDGTHPQYGHSPPTSLASTLVTCGPASVSPPGGVLPARAHPDHHDVGLLNAHVLLLTALLLPG